MSETSPLAAAQQIFADAVPFRASGEETCSLSESLGRTLYREIVSPTDLPPYHRAIVEGFVVHSKDTASASEESPVSFSVAGTIKPGDEACPPLQHGQGLEVATGVVVPDGAEIGMVCWVAWGCWRSSLLCRAGP